MEQDELKPKPLEEASPDVQALLARQVEILVEHRDTAIEYTFRGVELWVFHGLIRMAAEHPGFQQHTSKYSKSVVDRFRVFCKAAWVQQGLTADEATKLDELREQYAEEGFYRDGDGI